MGQKTTSNVLLIVDHGTRGLAIAEALHDSGMAKVSTTEMGQDFQSHLESVEAQPHVRPVVIVVEPMKLAQQGIAPHNVAQEAIRLFKPHTIQFKHDSPVSQTVAEWAARYSGDYDPQQIMQLHKEIAERTKKLDKRLPKGRTTYTETELIDHWVAHTQNLGIKLGRLIKAGKVPPVSKMTRRERYALERFQTDLKQTRKAVQVSPVKQAAIQRAAQNLDERRREVEVAGSKLTVNHRKPSSGVQPKNPALRPTQTERTTSATLPMSSDRLPPRPGGRKPIVVDKKPHAKVSRGKPTTKTNPQPTPALPLNSSGNEYWDRRKNMRYYSEAVSMARELAPDAKTVLDVGGRGCPYALELPGVHVTQVDPDRGLSTDRCTWIKADFMQWEVPEERFDVVFCLQVLEHVVNPAAFLQKLLQVGKVVIISVPYNWAPEKHHLHHHLKPETVKGWARRGEDAYRLVKEDNRTGTKTKRMVFGYVNTEAGEEPEADETPKVPEVQLPVGPTGLPLFASAKKTGQAPKSATDRRKKAAKPSVFTE